MRGSRILARDVMADGATCDGAEDGVMMQEMPGNAAGDGALDAALGLGTLERHETQGRDQGQSCGERLHGESPVGIRADVSIPARNFKPG